VRQHDHWEINVMNADGSNVAQVTQANPFSFVPVNNVAPTWSPDSKQVLFLSDRNGKWEFFVANPDGSGLKQVLKTVTDSVPIHYNFMNERVIDWIK
jgi:Tol biopolymer transport system component